MTENTDFTMLTADVVAAYVSNNPVPAAEMATLIGSVHQALTAAVTLQPAEATPTTAKPAVPIRKSVQEDTITCLECGKSYKSLKRHLRSHHGSSPEEYRFKWRLAHDYPMVAPNYARQRSRMAKESGLGRRR